MVTSWSSRQEKERVAGRNCGVSISSTWKIHSGDSKNLPGHWPGKPAQLALLEQRGWTRWPEQKPFCDAVRSVWECKKWVSLVKQLRIVLGRLWFPHLQNLSSRSPLARCYPQGVGVTAVGSGWSCCECSYLAPCLKYHSLHVFKAVQLVMSGFYLSSKSKKVLWIFTGFPEFPVITCMKFQKAVS